MDERTFTTLFSKHQKCVINADLDGILSGILLYNLFGWEIIGFSMCNGKPNDDLWLPRTMNFEDALNECVFLDLPIVIKNVKVIDQHYNALDINDIEYFRSDKMKANPNIFRSMHYSSQDRGYTRKYPFGTVHYIIAELEKHQKQIQIDLDKQIDGFTGFDVLLRADRVIGNTIRYTLNCKDWIKFLSNNNEGAITRKIYDIINLPNLDQFALREKQVEAKLKDLGCARKDGDCSNLLTEGDISKLNNIIKWLSDLFDLKAPIISDDIVRAGLLTGERYPLSLYNYQNIKNIIHNDSIFSYAIVTSREISVTRLKTNK